MCVLSRNGYLFFCVYSIPYMQNIDTARGKKQDFIRHSSWLPLAQKAVYW